jgi:AcrR family transcriptional regulator
MARTRTSPPVAERVGAGEPIPQVFRRATAQDAMDVARATFLNGIRVDMGELAKQLSVARATLYRWCGSRERLHEQILAQRAREFSTWARGEAEGEGDDRVLDHLRLMLDATAQAQPVREFIAREPQLALRILTREYGEVHRVLVQGLADVAAESHTPRRAKALQSRLDVAVQVATALQWVTIAIADEPQSERIVAIVRTQISAGRSSASR